MTPRPRGGWILLAALLGGAPPGNGAPPPAAEKATWKNLRFTGAVDLYQAVGLDPVTFLEAHPLELGGVVSDGRRFYAALRRGVVVAYDPVDERVAWSVRLPGASESRPVVAGGRLFAGTTKGTLEAFEVEGGKPLWSHEFRTHPLGGPAIAGERLFLQTADDTLFALSVTGGEWIWQYRREGAARRLRIGVGRSPVVGPGGRVFAGFSTGHVGAFAAEGGTLLWERRIGNDEQFPDVVAAPVLDGAGGVVAGAYRDGLYRMKQETGDLVWTAAIDGVSDLAVAGDRVVAADVDGFVAGYRLADGKELWRRSLEKASPTSGLVRGGWVFYGTSEGDIVGLSIENGKVRWKYHGSQGISSGPGWGDGGFFALTNRGVLIQFAGGN